MSKPDLGTKRVCPTTGRKFYDLNKDPVVSPYTGQSFPRSTFDPPVRGAAAPSRARPAAVEEEEVEPAAAAGPELVSLDEVEAGENEKATVGDEDVDLAEDDTADEPFVEEEEAGEDDVAALIDGDLKDDEET